MSAGSVIALIGLILSFIIAFARFVAGLAEFSAAVRSLTEEVKSIKRTSQKEHDELWQTLDRHEERIRHLELEGRYIEGGGYLD